MKDVENYNRKEVSILMEGLFVTIEGPDGAGKTSVLKELTPLLQFELKTPLLVTREPGGVPTAEAIRNLILHSTSEGMDAVTESLLYAAARREHLIYKIEPAVEQGYFVLCDRYVDSSLAYQGAGRRLGMDYVAEINEFAIGNYMPDLTLYLDVDSDTGLQRIRQDYKRTMDRFEQEDIGFHQRVRHGYLKLAEESPDRIVQIDARNSLDYVVEQCFLTIKNYFPKYFLTEER